MRVTVVGGHGKTGRAGGLRGADAAYLVAPNFHPDEPAYVAHALGACRAAGVGRVVYHSVASPYVPGMPHHLGKAAAEDLVRRSGLAWTILQPGVYLQNFDLSGPVRVPYDVHARFGFLDLADLGAAAATVLLGDGHVGATYELASRTASVAEIAADAGTTAERVDPPSVDGLDERQQEWLRTMFAYYDDHGLPAGTLPLRALLERG